MDLRDNRETKAFWVNQDYLVLQDKLEIQVLSELPDYLVKRVNLVLLVLKGLLDLKELLEIWDNQEMQVSQALKVPKVL